jgi:hypothetical protein
VVEQKSHHKVGSERDGRVVYRKSSHLERKKFQYKRESTVLRHRRVLRGLRMHLKWRLDYAGRLERERSGRPHQPERIESNPASFREMEGAFKGTSPTHKNRQSGSLLLFEKSWRKNRGAKSNNQGDLEIVFRRKDSNSKGNLDTYRGALFPRFPQQRFQRDRMGSERGDFPANNGSIWSSRGRQIRLRHQSQAQEVQFIQSHIGERGRSSRRTIAKLEGDEKLRMSSSQSSLKNPQLYRKSKGTRGANHSTMEKPNLVSESNEFGEKKHRDSILTPELLWDERHNPRALEEPQMEVFGDRNPFLRDFRKLGKEHEGALPQNMEKI